MPARVIPGQVAPGLRLRPFVSPAFALVAGGRMFGGLGSLGFRVGCGLSWATAPIRCDAHERDEGQEQMRFSRSADPSIVPSR